MTLIQIGLKPEVVRMHRLDNSGSVKAYCDIQFGDSFIVKGFKMVEGKEGLFVAMPSEVGINSRKSYSIFIPLNDDVKTAIENCIIEAYSA